MKTKTLLLATLLALGSFHAASAAEDISAVLQKGLFEEEANHNLDAAIKAYQAVIERLDEQRKFAATAVFRLGECYRKLNKTNEAVAQYQRVLREFGDQDTLVNLSQQNLAGLGSASANATAIGSNAGRQEQQRLLQAEIQIAQQELALTKDQYGAGTVSQAEVSTKERELLRLQRQLAALDEGTVTSSASGPGFAQRLQNIVARANVSEQDKELQRIRALIKDSPDLINSSVPTPLFNAAQKGQLAVAQYLLTNNADPNVIRPGAGAGTALQAAVEGGHKSMAELLLANGADPNLPNNTGQTALHLAAQSGFKAIAEILLAHKANPNLAAKDGRTPLHVAATFGRMAVAELLIAQGAQVDARNQSGETPLYYAVADSQKAMVEFLANHKADVNVWGSVGGNRETPVYLAARRGDLGTLEVLLRHHADASTRVQGETPLHTAARSENAEACRLLLAAKADVNARNAQGSTPLIVALGSRTTGKINQAVDLVELLLQNGADVNAQDDNYTTPLSLAVEAGAEDLVKLILDRKPNLEIKDKNGVTPLQRAVLNRKAQVVELLLEAGANPNVKIENGSTPLHWAASNYMDKRIVAALLGHKADPNTIDNSGNTPLSLALDMLGRAPTQGRPGSLPVPGRPRLTLEQESTLTEVADLLRKAGAQEDLRRRSLITVSRVARNLNLPIFYKDTNNLNRYTLCELLASFYVNPGKFGGSPGSLAFPDLAHIKIKKLPNNEIKDVDLTFLVVKNTNLLSDIVLNWGDIVEIPELDHGLNENWPGFPPEFRDGIEKRLKRQVEIVVKGEHTKVTLLPFDPSKFPSQMTGVVMGGIGVASVTFSQTDSVKPAPVTTLYTFRLREALTRANVLLVSSDLSRVKVRRLDAATGKTQEWSFNLADDKPYDDRTDLWLRDGDVIEVPEK